jgi:hypothetical protein
MQLVDRVPLDDFERKDEVFGALDLARLREYEPEF